MKTTEISNRKVTTTGGQAIEEGQFVCKLAPVAGLAALAPLIFDRPRRLIGS